MKHRIKRISITSSCKRLLIEEIGKTEWFIMDFDNPDQTLGVLKNMCDSIPYVFTVRDIATEYTWSSKK
jgi:hypothetical protein